MLITKANKNKYKDESKIISKKLKLNNTRITLLNRRNTNTHNMGSISSFFLFLADVITIIEDKINIPI